MKNQWQKKRLKFCDTLIMGQSPDGTSVNTDGYGVPFMQGNSEFGELHPSAKLATTEPAKFCSTNDVLISVRAPVGAVNIADKEYAIGRGLCAIRPHQHDSKFLFYLCKIQAEQLNSLATGTTFTAVSTQQVGNLHVCLPPISEQCRIAAYLDEQTAKIDRLMELRRRQIALLKEQRAALIQQAVTRGLNPNVPMKDSGLPWLGEIPAHWEIKPLGTFASVKARLGWKGLKAEEYVDEGYIFLATPNLKGEEIDFDNVNYITKERYFESPEIMLREKDILMVKDGATLGIVTLVKYLPAPATVNGSSAVIRCYKNCDSEFLCYWLRSNSVQKLIDMMKGGMGVPHLFQSDIRRFPTAVPPLNEQPF